MERVEDKYFIDEEKYNCPFCKNRGIKYVILGIARFDESNNKEKYAVFVECSHCNKVSMHLSKYKHFAIDYNFAVLSQQSSDYSTYCVGRQIHLSQNKINFSDILIENTDFGNSYYFDEANAKCNIDNELILHIPTSFFTIDEKIPKKLRDLLTEADNCIKMNALTGASACIRKTIYEFILEQKLEGDDYEHKIKSLKGKHPLLEDVYVDMLSGIQGITCDQVHEKSYEDFDNQHAKLYIEILKEIFNTIYVLPDELKNKKSKIDSFIAAIKKDKKEST